MIEKIKTCGYIKATCKDAIELPGLILCKNIRRPCVHVRVIPIPPKKLDKMVNEINNIY